MPTLSPQTLVSIDIGKDYMLRNGYIHTDFDDKEWAAPHFLEQAARELLDEEWTLRSTEKLPQPTDLDVPDARLG